MATTDSVIAFRDENTLSAFAKERDLLKQVSLETFRKLDALEREGDGEVQLLELVALVKRWHAAGMVSDQGLEQFRSYEAGASNTIARPGREENYSIDVHTRESGIEPHQTFRVAATNALDAYVALSKRATYRLINDVETVRVFAGDNNGRLSEFPLRSFNKDELIFV